MPSDSPTIDGLVVRISNSEREEDELVMVMATSPASIVNVAGWQPASVRVTAMAVGALVVPVVPSVLFDEPHAVSANSVITVAPAVAARRRVAVVIAVMYLALSVFVR